MDAPAVLLIHGFGSNAQLTWERSGWTGMLERANRRWVAPDLLGHGTSRKPYEPDAYSVATLLAGVLEAIGAERVDVVGYSLGGELALELAAAHPDRVRRVAAGGLGAGRPLSSVEAAGVLLHVTDGRPLPAGPAVDLWSTVTANAANDERALAACIVGVMRSARAVDLASIAAPTLLFAGTDDRLAEGMELLGEALPRAEIARVPGRRHGTTLSASALKRRALEFITSDLV